MSTPANQIGHPSRRRLARIVVLAVITTALFALLFVQQAFDTLQWLVPASPNETLIFYALSTINFLSFIVLLMVLVRNLIKLRRERRQMKLGARFKTRLVILSIAISLLPVIFLFFATSGLINRSVEKWFSIPAEEILRNAWDVQHSYVDGEQDELGRTAATIARLLARTPPPARAETLAAECDNQRLSAARLFDRDGRLLWQKDAPAAPRDERFQAVLEKAKAAALRGGSLTEQIIAGTEQIELVAAVPVALEPAAALVIVQKVAPDIAERITRINEQQREYDQLKSNQRLYKRSWMQTLALITLLVLFIATWMALYVARTIAIPVQQLAQATERIKQGELGYQAEIVGDDELAALALSFNEMTAELAENRQRLDERRGYIEAILQSLSAGVISLDERLNVTTINAAAQRLLQLPHTPQTGTALESLLPEDEREELRRLLRRAARLRSVTREVHFTLANQVKLDAAVTVAALLDLRGESRGTVIVIEDLTELIDAQRRAAWSEVARRMAHEIKNPLTPIRLSAERLAKNLLGDCNGPAPRSGLTERQTQLVRECTTMIGTEVATLQRMVDEFSNFARLPNAKLQAAALNEVVAATLKLYDERLDAVKLEGRLAPALPTVMIDAEQIKRLLVNLIDNAAEALSEAPGERRIIVETRAVAEREAVELLVSDTGPGIPAPDRERIFEPYFSTRKRGTGLGLAIVSRIVAEHQGRLRVQENRPQGARFIIELPGA